MKTISDNLGRIIAALAAICLLITSVVYFRAPIGGFFRNVVGKETNIAGKVVGNINPEALNLSSSGGGVIKNTGYVPDGGVYTCAETGEVLNGGDPLPAILKSNDTFKYEDITYTLTGVTGKFASLEELEAAREEVKAEFLANEEIVAAVGGSTWDDVVEFFEANGMTEEQFWSEQGLSEDNIVNDENAYWTCAVPRMMASSAKSEIFSYSVAPTVVDSVPEGATYTANNGTVYQPGDTMPITTEGDIFTYGDYDYTYKSASNGWNVTAKDNKESYGEILTSINNINVTDMTNTFYHMLKLTTAPTIPDTVTRMQYTFRECYNLKSAPTIPNSVTIMNGTFWDSGLTTAPTIPNSVTDMSGIFDGCSGLRTYVGSTDSDGDFSDYKIPDGVTTLSNTFNGCIKLTTAPTIPNNVTDMFGTFEGCTGLTTAPTIPNSVTNLVRTFEGCTGLTTAPTIPDGVMSLVRTFKGCTGLTTAPTIPNSVTWLEEVFSGCTGLTTAPIIPNNVTGMPGIFNGCSNLRTYVGTTDSDGDFSDYKIPDGVTTLSNTFKGCTGLTTAPTIPESVTTMEATFRNCTSLTGTITINAKLSNVGSYGAYLTFDGTVKDIILTGSSPYLDKLASRSNVTVQQ